MSDSAPPPQPGSDPTPGWGPPPPGPPPAPPGAPWGAGLPPPPPPTYAGYTGGYTAYQPGGGPQFGPKLAEPTHRLLARVLDSLVAIALYIGVSVPFGLAQMGNTRTAGLGVNIGVSILGNVVAALAVLAYEVLLVGLRGQTLGKMATGIKVVGPDGDPVGIPGAMKRHVPSIVLWLAGAIPLVGFLGFFGGVALAITNIVLVYSSGSSVYDKVGGTAVVAV